MRRAARRDVVDQAVRRLVVADAFVVEDRAARLVDAVGVGVLHDAGECRCLGEREVLGRDAEVVFRRRVDAVRLTAEVRDVEVAEKDVVLGILLLQRDRVAHLLELALDAFRAGCGGRVGPAVQQLLARGGVAFAPLDEDVLDVLLADRRATLGLAAALHVLQERTRGSDQVDPAVLIETGVLAGEDRVVHHRSDFVELDGRTVLIVELRQLDILARVGVLRVQSRGQHELVDVEHARKIVEHRDRARRGGAGQRDCGSDGGGDEDTRRSAETDQSQDAAEHTAGRPFRFRHRLDRRGATWANP